MMTGYALAEESTPAGWFFFGSKYEVGSQRISDNIHGARSAYVKSQEIEVSKARFRDLVERAGDRIGGVLVQGIDVKGHVGKHFHLSAYIKVKPRDLDKLRKTLAEYLKNADPMFQEEMVTSSGETFNKGLHGIEPLVSRLQKTFSAGFEVYTYKNGELYTAESTSEPGYGVADWQRVNVEIGIPEGAETVIVKFWIAGLGALYIDHLKIVEQGDKHYSYGRPAWIRTFNKQTYQDYLEFLTLVRTNAGRSIENPSFEK